MLYKIFLLCVISLIIILSFGKVLSDPLEAATVPVVKTFLSIKEKVQLEFGSTSPMIGVIECESNFRQFRADGTPLKSPTSDVGVMQINQVHWSEAERLGLDIFNSEDDNIKMGRIVYDEQGIEAWMCFKR